MESEAFAGKRIILLMLLVWLWLCGVMLSMAITMQNGLEFIEEGLFYIYSRQHPDQPMMLLFIGRFLFPARYLYLI